MDKRTATDREHDIHDAFIDGLIMEEIHGQNEERLNLKPLADMCDSEEEKPLTESVVETDDVSGEPMDPCLIVKARQEEMHGFKERGVYHHVPRRIAEADPEGKFIGVRWVDVNKGTKEVPKVRSRLVGQEFAHGPRRDVMYAPTPPLAAARYLLSTCASRGKSGPGNHRILLLDIRKAFLYGKILRTVYIGLPSEDPMSEVGNMVGKLDKAMYGTRDASAAWQADLEKTMIELGFRPVVSTPCLCYHPLWRIRVVGHVDDLMCVGPRSGLDIFLEKLKVVYELTLKFLGPDAGEEQQGKFLGRSICWRTDGLTWTGNVKLVKEALDEWDMREANEVETPGMTDEYDVQSLLNADLMSKESAAKYRRTAAKLNYLALDNPLIAFASKRSFEVHELTKTRRRSEIEENI